MRFEDYHIAEEIKRSLRDLDFRRPTDIQYKAIPSILKKEDVLAIAQTGTGKTAAFAIPVIHLLQKRKESRPEPGIKCVVMAPTHELALQITEVFQSIGKYTDIHTLCVIGGVDQDPQIDALEKEVDILVATPGRLFDLQAQGHIRLGKVEILVLDEADHMLDLGFIKDIEDLGKRLPRHRQTLFFSATIDERIKKTAYSLVRNPIRIQISPKNPVAKNIDHFVAYIEMEDKRFFLERLIKENPERKFMVFVRTIVRAERVAKAMERADLHARTIHREKTEQERSGVIQAYREGEFKVLIATDISARGIDIPDIDYVINYDLPEAVEMYVHRVGRTGRGKRRGLAVSFVSSKETETLQKIEAFLKKPIEELEINRSDYSTTLEMAQEDSSDWRALMEEGQAFMEAKKKKNAKTKAKRKQKKAKKKKSKKR